MARSKNSSSGLSQNEYETLAEFRYQLARFLRRRSEAARAEGLQPQQYELLLALAGLSEHKEPTIKNVAAQLCLEHHSVVELADRLEKHKLLIRRSSPRDKRVALLQMTSAGQKALNRIVRFSFSQLRQEGPALIHSLRRVLKKRR